MVIGIRRKLVLLLSITLVGAATGVAKAEVSIGGFIPLVGIGMSDEFDSAAGSNVTFFIAEREDSLVGTPLGPSDPQHPNYQQPFYDIALLDTGAATHILTPQAAGPNGFDIDGNGFDGTNLQPIGGATGSIITTISDPAAIFTTGLKNRTQTGASLGVDAGTLRGQSNVATLTAPEEWKLPNILGLPMAAQHAISIRNDEPQIFAHQGRTVRTPQVDFIPLGTGNQQGITRRAQLNLRPGTGFIQGPLYVFDFGGIGQGQPLHENPASPTVVENGAVFIDVSMSNGGFSTQNGLLFDTGADLTVISPFLAPALGIDPVLDTPDFVLEVEGSGGVQGGVPGYYIDTLSLNTIGGTFQLQNVPIAILEVTDPADPGNTIDGILGMHLFNGRNIVIDTNTSVGQGGNGPSLYIGDSVTNTRTWSGPGGGTWNQSGHWQEGAAPNHLSDVVIAPGTAGQGLGPNLPASTEIYRLTIAGQNGAEAELIIRTSEQLEVYGQTLIETDGTLEMAGGKLGAQFINMEGGRVTGDGEIELGTGPISGQLRNIGGVVAPGGDAIQAPFTGTLAITGDYSSLEAATLQISLLEDGDSVTSDLLTVSRLAFLAGTLEVEQIGTSLETETLPEVGDTFTILTADGGVFGEFDAWDMPEGYTWSVLYNENDVTLRVEIAGDFNADGLVNATDYTTWRNGLGTFYGPSDYDLWRGNYGATAPGGGSSSAIPEPASAALVLSILTLVAGRCRENRA